MMIKMIQNFRKTICDNLARIRVARRYSQREIATVLSVKQPSYRSMELGTTQISAVHLATLAEFYKVPVQHFYQNGMVLHGPAAPPEEEIERMREQVQNGKVVLDIYAKRIEELEAKVKRRDAKIDLLLAKSTF